MIQFNQVSFGYSKKFVLNNISFQVQPSKVYGLLGHNGAGKTTLLRLALGLFKPEGGTVLINNNLPEKSRNIISYMPENNGIYNKLTANQNLYFRGSVSNLSKEDIAKKSNDLMSKLNLLSRANETVSVWSHGMRKRLALACALITEPQILLLDEPTNGIDPESLEVIIDMLNKLKDTTILVSSHNLDFIHRIMDKIIIIENGSLVYDGVVEDNTIQKTYFQQLKKYRGEQ